MKYQVAVQRVETRVERLEVEAGSPEKATELADEMIESGELSFDGAVVHATESVFEVLEFDPEEKETNE